LTWPARGIAGPIFLDDAQTQFYDLKFFVSSSITLVPGQTGFVEAANTNNGNVGAGFTEYDSSNSIGGFGWNFNDLGLAIGFQGQSFSGFPSDQLFQVEDGKIDPLSLIGSEPNFSYLSNVTIEPGETLEFELYSWVFDSSAPLRIAGIFSTANRFVFGSLDYAGYDSAQYSITVRTCSLY
jgi:hypothetical protein